MLSTYFLPGCRLLTVIRRSDLLPPIDKVEVSIGPGPWQNARLIGQRHRHSWQWWELLTRIDSPGETTLRARATDLAGRTQPERPQWNRLGYGGNAVHNVPLLVR